MKAIAFYLPQYHAIPENDKIYGKGFTEWDNVRAAQPLYAGHWQPHIPHKSIGYYNLLDEDFLVYQHELAYANGIECFCYYYYNMSGKRLLEKPLQIINASQGIKNEFCLCFAMDSWYDNRRPDRPIFLQQEFSPAHAAAVFMDLLPYFANDRYIKINGRPFFAVFAPERNPLIRQYADIWRQMANKQGLRGIWLAGVESYLGCNPKEYGFDSMIEFAPAWRQEALLSPPACSLRVFDYLKTVKFMMDKPCPDYLRNRCAFPGWDNTPRRRAYAALAHNQSPEAYKIYLNYIISYTKQYLPQYLQYIFINAWNEWGEGCHLEPDEKYGNLYLDITREALAKA